MTSQHWAVVGAGVLGMELARRLRNEGHAVTVLEAAPEVGGLAATWKIGGITWDKHYHVILLSDLYTQKLLTDLGLQDKFVGVETKTGFYTDGQLYSMSNTVEFLKFPPLSLISKLRLGGTIFLASRIKNWRKLERIRVADWLERWSRQDDDRQNLAAPLTLQTWRKLPRNLGGFHLGDDRANVCCPSVGSQERDVWLCPWWLRRDLARVRGEPHETRREHLH